MDSSLKCPECGKIFYKDTAGWAYGNCCSYTCYDHFKLRAERKYLNPEKYFEWVNRCEGSMKQQGKTILNPIKKEELVVKSKKSRSYDFFGTKSCNKPRSNSFHSLYSSKYYNKKKNNGKDNNE